MDKQHRSPQLARKALLAEEWVGVNDAAALLQVGASSIQRFVDEGVLQAWKTQGGHRRISRESIHALLERRFSDKLKLRILVSDSSDPDREHLVTGIQAWNTSFEVLGCAHGVDSILLVERHRPDLWIVSADLGGLSVVDAVVRIASNPEMPSLGILIGLLSELPAAEAVELRNLGIQVYSKPWPLEELRGVIANALATKTRSLRNAVARPD